MFFDFGAGEMIGLAVLAMILIGLNLGARFVGLGRALACWIYQACLLGLIVFNACYMGGVMSPVMAWLGIVPFLPFLAESFEAPPNQVTLLMTAFSLAQFVAARRQHEVIGGAEFAGGEFLRHQAGGQMVRHAGAAVLLLQHERAEAELRAAFQQIPRHALFPFGNEIELHRLGFDFLLRELACQVPKLALLLRQTNIEHDFPFDKRYFGEC